MARGSERREQILRSAAQVFLEHGYDAASMNFVAEKAEVTKPGLYYHFESKQDLLFAIMTYAMDLLERETGAALAEAGPEAGPVERLRRILRSHARIVTAQKDGALTLLVIDEMAALRAADRRRITERKRRYFETIRGTLEELGSERRLRTVDPTLAAFSLVGMVMWISKWFRPTGELSGDEVAEQVTELAVAAVLADGPSASGGAPS